MKKLLSWVMNQLSKLGRAMFVPLAATPIAGLLARISASDMLNLSMIENASWVVFFNDGFIICDRLCHGICKCQR